MKKLLILTTILLVSMAGCKKEPQSLNSGEPLFKEGGAVKVSLDSKAQSRSFEYTEEYDKKPINPTIICMIEYVNNIATDTLMPYTPGIPYPSHYKGEWYEINAYADRTEVRISENTSAESREIICDLMDRELMGTVTITQQGAQ